MYHHHHYHSIIIAIIIIIIIIIIITTTIIDLSTMGIVNVKIFDTSFLFKDLQLNFHWVYTLS
jgi:hypothetical protein